MRRIPRLRTPAASAVTAAARPAVAPLVGGPSRSISAAQIPAPPRPSLCSTSFARFYSDKRPQPGSNIIEPESKEVSELESKEVAAPETNQVTGPEKKEVELLANEGEASLERWPPSREDHRLFVPPPRERSEYPLAEDVTDSSYIPATNWDGLKFVGGLEHWWNRGGHWKKEANWSGFKPKDKTTEPVLIEAAVRRAVVETFALRQAGREAELMTSRSVGGRDATLRFMELDVKADENGVITFRGDVTGILDGLAQADESAPAGEAVSADEARQIKESWDRSWKNISLLDPKIRFAVRKRFFQLSGQLVADHHLPAIKDVRTLLNIAQKPPKPKKLVDQIEQHQPELLSLPNVAMSPKRITRGDREVVVGRFKLIQEEWRKRDLPLHGVGDAEKNWEIAHLQGRESFRGKGWAAEKAKERKAYWMKKRVKKSRRGWVTKYPTPTLQEKTGPKKASKKAWSEDSPKTLPQAWPRATF
ncbi:hypothetical protein F4780DRAFT_563272 [Xylariomycetidae sp. FL0641]|nr:hypothetical protein F4780DRAFT_563272 [Xylariomycetidae sp. FL0641]